MVKNKNPIVAFLLAFLPGVGLMYLGKVGRGVLFSLAIIGSIPFGYALNRVLWMPEAMILSIGVGFLLYVVSIIHTALTASKSVQQSESQAQPLSSERFYTIILSMVPGLGHFQLGLMNRGVTFLASFLGVAAMILFVTFITGTGGFMVFLIILPVIWVYNFFDTMQLLNKKEAGEDLKDRSILEDFEDHHQGGKKSVVLATLLSMFPGAGHLYLGYQRRGVQLMAAFLFSIYILDVLRLGIFLFLVPIIWFFSFFDGLQRASRHNKEPLEDEPIVSYFVNHQKWIGIALIFIGVYYPITNIVLPTLAPYVNDYFQVNLYNLGQYMQTGIVCALLIIGGVKLLGGSKKKANMGEE
ncbi:DUF6677 family protein [Guptibacillus hwajinpoensis]|uniref:Multi-TM2 domain-containing protein n=1 Tax=Guptibacillus hwajinpoensis TaxID=208199 RepID=A0A0J6D1D3_9BACL|nr:DUF6677 family protein [Alkalihalobacillus macyae]KMM39155.1 multi-TM2 domain-containing protein [Alkalihalobacillus macyae]